MPATPGANPEPIKGGMWEIPENTTRIELHYSPEWARKNGINVAKPGALEGRIEDWIVDELSNDVTGVHASYIVNSDHSFVVTVTANKDGVLREEQDTIMDVGYHGGAEMLAF
jgi:hypothetical protein